MLPFAVFNFFMFIAIPMEANGVKDRINDVGFKSAISYEWENREQVVYSDLNE